MKKAVFIILLALPVFLMITISVTGRLIILYTHTAVEKVFFADEAGNEITTFKIGLGKTAIIKAVVSPEDATNKKVSYSLKTDDDFPEFSYDEETNELTGLSYGTARLKAVTDDKNLETELVISVRDENVTEVTLNVESLTLRIGESFKLSANVLPQTALNRNVTWSSSNTASVKVGMDGTVTALAVTPEDEPVLVVVTTQDGEFTASCAVTVLEGLPPLAFFRIGGQTPVSPDENIIVSTLEADLADYLYFDEELYSFEEIVFVKSAGSGALDGQRVEFSQSGQYITVTARIVRDGQTLYETRATFRCQFAG